MACLLPLTSFLTVQVDRMNMANTLSGNEAICRFAIYSGPGWRSRKDKPNSPLSCSAPRWNRFLMVWACFPASTLWLPMVMGDELHTGLEFVAHQLLTSCLNWAKVFRTPSRQNTTASRSGNWWTVSSRHRSTVLVRSGTFKIPRT